MIAIVNTFKASYKDVRKHLPQWIKVVFAPFVIWAIGFVAMGIALYPGEGSLVADFFNFVYYVLDMLAIMVLYINGFRYAALGEGGDKWWTFALNMRLVKMILYYLLIIVLFILYAAVTGGITVGSYFLVESIFLTSLLGVLSVLGLIYLVTRLTLTFLYVAIDQKNALRASWHIMKGHVLRVFGLFCLILLVVLGVVILGAAIIGLVSWLLSLVNAWLGAIILVLFVPFGVCVWLVSTALTMKAIVLVNKKLTGKK